MKACTKTLLPAWLIIAGSSNAIGIIVMGNKHEIHCYYCLAIGLAVGASR